MSLYRPILGNLNANRTFGRQASSGSKKQAAPSLGRTVTEPTDLAVVTAAPTCKKRKATEPAPSNVNLDEIDVEGMYMDANCDQVRRKIRRFIDSGEMNVGQFATTIGVSRKSLSDFLGQNGAMKGAGSASYDSAWSYFKKREIAGSKMLTVKKAKLTTTASTATAAGTTNVAASAAPVSTPIDITGILLSGEASDSVPVYDSCDEVRRKINAHLVKPGVVQAQFCRDLAAQIHTETKKIQSKQLSDFRSKKGPWAGNTSIVFYTAYVYFEKLRLAEGKFKSKHREGMEAAHPYGLDTERARDRGYLCGPGQVPVMDRYGLVSIRR